MTILSRYILREFLKVLALSLAAFTLLFLIVDFFDRLDSFLRHQARPLHVLSYLLLLIPKVLTHITPLAVLLSTLLTLGIFSRNQEITAMRAGGLSLLRLAAPLLGVATLGSLLLLAANEFLVPYATQHARYFREVLIEKRAPSLVRQDKVWMRISGNALMNVAYISPEGVLHGIAIYRFDPEFSLREQIEARELRWENTGWRLYHGSRFHYTAGGVEPSAFETLPLRMEGKPEEIRRVEKKADEMSYRELYHYVAKLRREGYNPARYVVDLHAKFSLAFSTLLMALLGIPYALTHPKTGRLAAGIGLSLAVAFLYWVILSAGISLGRSGTVPPLLAAWFGNLLFGAWGTYLLLGIRY
jgi:lipopolysaccharide export system permease protein